MANISISDLQLAGSDLFLDSESYMKDLSDSESIHINGARRARGRFRRTIGLSSFDCAIFVYEFVRPLPTPKRPGIPVSA